MRHIIRPVTLALVASLVFGAAMASAAPADGRRSIKIGADDAMKFSVQRIEAKPGERLQVVLTAQGAMSKSEMAHNWVLLDSGAKVDGFIMAAAMARSTEYIPASKQAQILAATALVGAGETASIDFQAPDEPGEYVFVCTFPGHYAGGMKGVLVVR